MSKITRNKQGLIVLIAGCILLLFLGIIYSWSVFVIPVSEVYDWDISSVRLVTAYMISFFALGMLLGGRLQAILKAEKIVLLGGLLLSAGMLVTAFIPASLAQLVYVSYGILGGLGTGVGYNIVITASQKWFPQNRGFATGLSVSAFGFSTVIFAPLIETLAGQYGIRHTFIILAAAFLFAALALFSFIRLPDDDNPIDEAYKALLVKKQYTITETIRTREFYFLTCASIFANAAFLILTPSIKIFSLERGLSELLGTYLVMLSGVTNAAGRLVVPIFSDRLGREKTVIIVILGTALGAFLLCFSGGIIYITAVVLITFCYGGYPSLFSFLTADYFGIKHVGVNYGAVMMGFALSALFSPVLIGLIDNSTLQFITLTATAIIAAVFIRLLAMSKGKM